MPLISIVAIVGVATNVSGKFWILSFTPIILNSSIILGCFFINDYWTIKSLPLAISNGFWRYFSNYIYDYND